MATYTTINLLPSDIAVISNSVGYVEETEGTNSRVPLNSLLDKFKGTWGSSIIFPVGSIIESIDEDFDPNDIYEGVWSEYGQGRTLIGSAYPDDTSLTESNINTTVGTYSHILTVSEMPSHSHAIGYATGVNYRGSSKLDVGQKSTANSGYWTSYTGGGQAHNNIQPYILCYRWRRVE